MSVNSNSNRIIYYDFIRAFAIFGVLACHCFAALVINVDIFNTKLSHRMKNCMVNVTKNIPCCSLGYARILKAG